MHACDAGTGGRNMKKKSDTVDAEWIPTANDIEWCRRLVQLTRDEALWGNSFGVHRINKGKKQLQLVEVWDESFRRTIHDRNVVAFGMIGWKVTDKPNMKYKKAVKEEDV
jgi:hypothetical protein